MYCKVMLYHRVRISVVQQLMIDTLEVKVNEQPSRKEENKVTRALNQLT